MKAVVLFNLGGPDEIKNVKPFLFNLFNDPAIIRLPKPVRWLLAKFISSRREEEATSIYKAIGGKSPIFEETVLQKESLQKKLPQDYEVFICMRYWKPLIEDVIKIIKNKQFEEVILLPLYPQFSTTTTESFFNEWDKKSRELSLNLKTTKLCCYPAKKLFIRAYVEVINSYILENKLDSKTRFLFSAHGLPEKIVKSGDPYPEHVEMTVSQIVDQIETIKDYKITYQSKVGPLKWLEPSTETEIMKAGSENKTIAIIPISFVSEHSETLYELDIQYKDLADRSDVKEYYRVPTVRNHPIFIKNLASLVLNEEQELCGSQNCRLNVINTKAA